MKRLRNCAEKVLVISCGPSVNDYKDQLKELCKDHFVIAIKGAYNLVPEWTDLHLFNCCNNPKDFYAYGENRPYVVCSSNYPVDHRIPPEQDYDLFLRVPFPKTQQDFLVFQQGPLSQYSFENGVTNRPCGPGIFLESCIWFIEWIRPKELVTLGIDICTQDANSHDHFWKDEEAKDFAVPGTNMDWEFEANRQFSKPLYNWFLTKGINWTILGNSCLWDGIPRGE